MSNSSGPPSWVVTWGTVLLGALLLFNVTYDAFSTSYSNPTLSLALLAAFCAAIGVRKALSGGD